MDFNENQQPSQSIVLSDPPEEAKKVEQPVLQSEWKSQAEKTEPKGSEEMDRLYPLGGKYITTSLWHVPV